MILANRAQNLKTSPTLFLVAKAKELASKGHPVISLTVGEPDWPTYPEVADAGIEAIHKGITKYTPANGTLELRKALAKKFHESLQIQYAPSEILIGPGAKFIIFSALQMLCNPGDEVIVPSPYWVSYPMMVELAAGIAKVVTCDEKENFKMTPEQLEKSISPKTKALILCSPSNPTGFIYTAEELKALAEVLKKYPQVVVISDDIYNRLMFSGERQAPHLLHVAPELRDRVVCIDGGSKAYSMTGWRVGWASGPEKLIKAMGDYQSQATGAPSSISQFAALAGVERCEERIKETNQLLVKRLNTAMSYLEKKVPSFKAYKPQGAFYLWINIKSLLGKKYEGQIIDNDKVFADILLDKFFVAIVPGLEFGNNGYFRMSIAADEKLICQAIDRIAELVSKSR